jgi:hypothetical protein
VVVPLTVWIHASRDSDIGIIVVLTLGALHLLYDGFIWRTPRPLTPTRPSQRWLRAGQGRAALRSVADR